MRCKEQLAADLAEKQNAMKWAQDSLARFRPRHRRARTGDPAMTAYFGGTDEGAREARAERHAGGRAGRIFANS